jgi:hypothetical protein
MTTPTDSGAQNDPEARLEQALIEEFLQRHGLTRQAVDVMPPEDARQILREASIYVAGRLAEIEARARMVGELQHKE